MRRPHTTISLFILSWFALAFVAPVQALINRDEPQLYKAYFLERHERDFEGARKLYQSALRDAATAQDKRAAKAGADRCRDQIAARNLAVLMPPDALAYVELNRPGEIIEKLCVMLGITTDDMSAILSQRPSAESKAPFHIPTQVAISPSLFEYLRGFGGAGFAMTGFDPAHGGPPKGVLVIHHGDVSLMKGLLETAFQFAPTAQKIAELPTFGVDIPEVGRLTGVLTECLLIVGTQRELVEAAVDRLTGDAPSLATRDDLRELMEQREGTTLFGFVNLQGVLKTVQEKMDAGDRREFKVANAFADLDSLRWASFSLGIRENTLGVQLAVRLADDHQSFAYNLMRLPPLSGQCLDNVPVGAAGLLGIGLNPALVNAAADAAKGEHRAVTGFDIGREFFGNIRELCAFVMPREIGESGKGLPSGGVILAVNDTARSKALWGQLLSLPGLTSGREPSPPKSSRIGGLEVTTFEIPRVGKVLMSEMDGRIAITTNPATLKACVAACDGGKSILSDEVMKQALNGLPTDSSLMAVAHVGRMASVHLEDNAGAAMAAQQARQICPKMVFCAGLGQSSNQMTLRASLSGLPDVNQVLKTYGPVINSFAGMAMQHQSRRGDRAVRKATKRVQVDQSEDEEEDDEADEE